MKTLSLPLPMLGVLCLLHGTAAAQTLVQPQQPPQARTPEASAAVPRLRSVVVTGDNPLDEATTHRTLAVFLQTELRLDTLQQVVTALEAALSAEGHSLHRVVLPAQEVTDTLRVQVVRFALGDVTVQGPPGLDVDNIRRGLPELQTGQTPHLARLAIQSALSNENPAKRVQVALKPSDDQPDQIDATVRVQTSPPLQGVVSLANTGNAASGRDRISISLLHANLLRLDHQLALAWTTSLARPDDVRQLGLSYRLPLYTQGAMLDVSWSDSTVLGQFGSFSSTGAGHTAAVQLTQHLREQGGWSRSVSVTLEDKVFIPSALTPTGGGPVVVLSQRRVSRPLTLGFQLRQQTHQTASDVALNLVGSLPGGGAASLAAYQSENARISSRHWLALRSAASHLRQFDAGWLLGTRAQGQWASTSLVAGEQFGVGGASSVRGMGERVLSADSGLNAGLELTTPALAAGWRAVALTEAGWLRQRRLGLDAKPQNDTVVSVGLGLRYAKGPVSWALDHARLVNGSTYAPASAQQGQSSWHLLLSTRF
ncbi:MAG: hypothetical protein RLZZ352_566 [Pseudomonadota bacterium]